MKKAVFLDIDGTLVTFDGTFPESAEKALRIAGDNGICLVICTGRTPTQIYPWLRETGLFHGEVAGAGADVRLNGRVIEQHFIARDELDRLIRWFDRTGTRFCLQGADGMYTTPAMNEYFLSRFGSRPELLKRREKTFGHVTVPDDIRSADRIEKVAYYGAPCTAEEMQAELGDYFCVTGSSFNLTDAKNGEITIRGYDKAYGMKCFLDAVGLTRRDSFGYGDGPNDFEMVEYAGTGVAMGNALPELKKAADQVTDPIDQNGLWNSFKKNGLLD